MVTLKSILASRASSDELVATDRKLIARVDGVIAERGDEGARHVAASTLYWEIARHIIRKSVDASPDRLSFTLKERYLLDFGLLDSRLMPQGALLSTVLREARLKPNDTEFRVRHASDALARAHSRLLREDEKHQLRAGLAKARRTLNESQTEVAAMRAHLERLYAGHPKGKRLSYLADQIYTILPIYSSLSTRAAAGDDLTDEEAASRKNMEAVLSELREEQTSLLSGGALAARLHDLDVRATISLLRVPQMEHEIGTMQEKLASTESTSTDLTPAVRTAHLGAVLDEIHALVREVSRVATRKERVILAAERPPLTTKTVWQLLRRTAESDPDLAENWRRGHWALPEIFILPGMGGAIYDARSSTIACSFVPFRSPEETFIAALARYRCDMSSELAHDFADLQRRGIARSFTKVRERFVTDYVTWVLRESQGFRKLPGSVHRWFRDKLLKGGGDV